MAEGARRAVPRPARRPASRPRRRTAAVSGFSVVPERLEAPAQRCERAWQELIGVGRVIGSVIVRTGRPDSELACALTLQWLGVQVQQLADRAARDADDLRAAGAGYTAAERRATG